ncbi:hypothetical protein ABZW30_36905 [Kitasatospora sp. NPDC004669]|uniref:hypothetical protein n=1 Tax=Kitasatospora sp. NPDC004669 TaxID=3154555 RepID=UPI0033BC84DB
MTYVRGMAPWVVFALLSEVGWQWGALGGFVVAVWTVLHGYAKGTPTSALIIEISGVVYLAALAAVAFRWPHSALDTYNGGLSFAWLALIAWGSLIWRRPFTLPIARTRTPRRLWSTPGFFRTNVIVTTVWAMSFTVSAGFVGRCEATGAGTLPRAVGQLLCLIAAAVFTARYSARVRARRAAAEAVERARADRAPRAPRAQDTPLVSSAGPAD